MIFEFKTDIIRFPLKEKISLPLLFEVFTQKNLVHAFLRMTIFSIISAVTIGFFFPVFASASNNENNSNLWDKLEYSFQLESQYSRPEVQTQIDWLLNHKSYLEQLGIHSKPYLYYILQEVQKRNLPGELALLPMVESTYNPFAYSPTGAAGLWQFTKNSGTNFGLQQNWWFDGRRDIYNSTNAALDYLTYLHHFFKGNWMLAIAAYHSGEGTVQRAVKYNGNHQRSTNFWSLDLPGDNKSYVPKLLAIASLIQTESKKENSSKLPYISNTPYFTRINVGTQIDLTNAAHLAGIPYPEFLKLNPGNNHWTTAPKGPHTIVLPLDKVNVFVSNLRKIPANERSDLLVKHNVEFDFVPDLEVIPESVDTSDIAPKAPDFSKKEETPDYLSSSGKIPATWHKVLHVIQKGESFSKLTQKYHVSETNIREWNHLSTKDSLQQGQKLTIWTANNISWSQHPQNNPVIYYTIRKGDTLNSIAKKYHVSVNKIMLWNPKLKPNHILTGNKVTLYL